MDIGKQERGCYKAEPALHCRGRHHTRVEISTVLWVCSPVSCCALPPPSSAFYCILPLEIHSSQIRQFCPQISTHAPRWTPRGLPLTQTEEQNLAPVLPLKGHPFIGLHYTSSNESAVHRGLHWTAKSRLLKPLLSKTISRPSPCLASNAIIPVSQIGTNAQRG